MTLLNRHVGKNVAAAGMLMGSMTAAFIVTHGSKLQAQGMECTTIPQWQACLAGEEPGECATDCEIVSGGVECTYKPCTTYFC
jgi:hypothetical protein